MPKLVEGLEFAVGNKSVGTKAWPELIGEELPLRKSSLSTSPDLDGLGARPDVREARRPRTGDGSVGLVAAGGVDRRPRQFVGA